MLKRLPFPESMKDVVEIAGANHETLNEALRIMSFMRNDEHIDAELFDLFLHSKIYQSYAEQFLGPGQIDEVDISDYLSGALP